MATSSIFQNVLIKDKRGIARIVNALEQSRATPAKDVAYSRPVEVIEDTDVIRRMFMEQTNDGLQDTDD